MYVRLTIIILRASVVATRTAATSSSKGRPLTMSHFSSPETKNTQKPDDGNKMKSLLSSPLFLSQQTATGSPTTKNNQGGGSLMTGNQCGNMGEDNSSNKIAGKSLMSSPLFPRNQIRENEDSVPARSQRKGGVPSSSTETDCILGGGSEHDELLRTVSSWIQELTEVHETLQCTSVENAIVLDSLYMTGAFVHDNALD